MATPVAPASPPAASPTTFVDLWEQLWLWANTHPGGEWFFRGQGGNWAIVPKIGRTTTYAYSASRERNMFAAFKSAARPLVTMEPKNDWEWLALAQHHGMPTRLVDWSTNMLVACWFAVTSSDAASDAFIYALEAGRTDITICDTTDGKTRSGPVVADPLGFNTGVYLVESSPVSPRITSQRGIFTAHGAPSSPLTIPSADEFTIPSNLRGEMQGQLLDIGIDASHIYPGLDGLCATLDWRFRSGKGFSALA